MTKSEASSAPAAAPRGAERFMTLVGLFVAAAAGLLGYLLAFTDATLDAATVGLVLAGVALVFCLRALWRMVTVLGRPDLAVALDRMPAAATASMRELREERRRLLRAIHELKFDFEMGKLSETDYKSVRQTYELRAIEVMRALDAGPELHPGLLAELAKRGISPRVGAPTSEAAEPESTAASAESPAPKPSPDADAAGSPSPADDDREESGGAGNGDETDSQPGDENPATSEAAPATKTCVECEGANDPDARFCKHCGSELPK